MLLLLSKSQSLRWIVIWGQICHSNGMALLLFCTKKLGTSSEKIIVRSLGLPQNKFCGRTVTQFESG